MKLLEERIKKDGRVFPGDVLKVDCFLNHQIDVKLLSAMGDEFYRLYKDSGVNKILTIEASGIAIASVAALRFDVPVVFAKKSKSSNVDDNLYSSTVKSYTHNNINTVIVCKDYVNDGDKILIVDDFLAKGEALKGLIDICNQAGAEVIGCGIAIEKVYQGGGNELRAKGVRIESLAMVESLENNTVTFAN